MLAGNAARLYDFDLDKLAPLAAQYGPAVAEIAQPLDVLPNAPDAALLKAAGRASRRSRPGTVSTRSEEFNQGLSQRRAQAVAVVLQRNFPNFKGNIPSKGEASAIRSHQTTSGGWTTQRAVG